MFYFATVDWSHPGVARQFEAKRERLRWGRKLDLDFLDRYVGSTEVGRPWLAGMVVHDKAFAKRREEKFRRLMEGNK